MHKLFYLGLPVLLISLQQNVTPLKSTMPSAPGSEHNKIALDSGETRILLASKKATLYSVGNIEVAADKQEKKKKYIDGYEILGSKKLSNKIAESLKTFLLDSNNYKTESSRCSFFAKYCLSFRSRHGSLHFFLPESAGCNVITIVKVTSIDHKETEFSFAKEILDKIKNE